MKITNRLGIILLSAFLILSGLMMFLGTAIDLRFMSYLLAALAIAAGCLLLVDK